MIAYTKLTAMISLYWSGKETLFRLKVSDENELH